MDRLDSMAALVAAVEEGSLAAAARRLHRSPAAVTRAIAALEDRLGTQLLHRTTRVLTLTRFGEDYVAACRKLLAELAAIESGAAAEQEKPRGLLTVTAPVLFGQMRLRPVIDEFLDANPEIEVRLLLLDRIVNLVDEGIDAAVRLAHLPDSGLKAVKLGEVSRVVCAAPAYLERCGTPRTPQELSAHRCIAVNAETWNFPGAKRQSIAIHPRLSCNANRPAIDSALEGRGIVRPLSYQVEEDLAAGRLVRLLRDFEPAPIPVHIVWPLAKPPPAKLRAFIDFATPRLKLRFSDPRTSAA